MFIAGVMQGSRTDDKVQTQHYRELITEILQTNVDGVEIIDPWALHPNSETYDAESARETFFAMTSLAGQADALVAYLPEASMGTAVEMWEAHRQGVSVFTISGMSANWVINLLSSRVFPSLEAFQRFVAKGGFAAVHRNEST